jgi:hypothetical protein
VIEKWKRELESGRLLIVCYSLICNLYLSTSSFSSKFDAKVLTMKEIDMGEDYLRKEASKVIHELPKRDMLRTWHNNIIILVPGKSLVQVGELDFHSS